jgi:hypothetical protein
MHLAMTANWEWNLIVGTTHTSRFDFEVGADILEGALKDFYGVFTFQFFSSAFDGGVNGAFGDELFAAKHGFVNQALN